MKCFNCKAEIPKNAKFCGRCGKKTFADRDLIARALAKDESARYELYKRAYDGVYWTAKGIVGSKEATEDVMQDTYMVVFQKLSSLKKPEIYTEWAKRIAASRATDWLRKNRRELLISDLKSDDDDGDVEAIIRDEDEKADPAFQIDQAETARLIQEILDSIDEKYRAAVMMACKDGMKMREIAELLGISENTVKTRVARGRKQVVEKVLRLEKQGTKLYSLAPFAFFLWLLKNLTADSEGVQQQQMIFDRVLSALNHVGMETANEAGGAAHEVIDALNRNGVEMANAEGAPSHMSDVIGKMNQAAGNTEAGYGYTGNVAGHLEGAGNMPVHPTGVEAHAGGATAAHTTAQAAGTAASAAGKGAATAAAHGIGTKIATGIVIAAVGVGGAGGGTYLLLSHHAQQSEMAAEDSVTESEEQTLDKDSEEYKMYQAYYDLLETDRQIYDSYGTAEILEGTAFTSTGFPNGASFDSLSGLCFAQLVDFDGDGSEELVLVYQVDTSYSETTMDLNYGNNLYSYYLEVWDYQDGECNMLYSQGLSFHYESGMFFYLTEMDGVPYLALGSVGRDGSYFDYEFYGMADGEFSVQKEITTSDTDDNEYATDEEAKAALGEWLENGTLYLVEDFIDPADSENTSNRTDLENTQAAYKETIATLRAYLGISDETDEEDSAEAMSDEEKAWRTAYAEYLESEDCPCNDSQYFYLVYVNDDDIPELYNECSYMAEGGHLIYLDNGVAKEQNISRGGFVNMDRSGYFMESSALSGYAWDIVYYYNGNTIEEKFNGGISSEDENGLLEEWEYEYSVNDESVTEEEYYQTLRAVIPEEFQSTSETGSLVIGSGERSEEKAVAVGKKAMAKWLRLGTSEE